MRAFEIHTFRDGQWKVDSVFDDRDLAVHEARKVDENGRYAGVRVIEENYDELSDLTTTRTIFRGKKDAGRAKAKTPAARTARRAAQAGAAKREHSAKAPPRPPSKKSKGVLVPVLVLFLIVFSGAILMFGLHHVGGLR